MSTKSKWTKIGPVVIVAAACAFGFANRRGAQTAQAAAEPQVIEIKAKKFEFSPNTVTLKKGQPVILRLTTEDRTHGFFAKPLNIDTDITPGKPTDVALTPDAVGEYPIICDHYCGTGHGNMKMTVTVVQ